MQKTANTDVFEEEEEQEVEAPDSEENDSDSSSDKEEVDLDSMSEEELREFAKREHQAKKDAVSHLRDKNVKRQTIEETITTPQEQLEDAKEDTTKIIREEAERAVREEHRKARIAEFSDGSTDWLKSQSWADDINKSDALYGGFSKELKRLSESKNVKSQAEFRKLMRLAAVNVTGKPDALLEENADAEVNYDKQQTPGYRSSSAPNAKRTSLTEAQIKMAEAFGNDPQKVYAKK